MLRSPLTQVATTLATAVLAAASAAMLLTSPEAHAAQAVETIVVPPARYAVVVQEQAALRVEPHRYAQLQAMLTAGDLLEVRAQRLDHLQVWDHRRERGGYIAASQVQPIAFDAADAPQLLAVLRFLRDTPGNESLGIAYAAAYLKAVPAPQLDAEPFDALGSMADRLARRASGRHPSAEAQHIADQLDAVRSLGVAFTSTERDGRMQLCYDGDAFRRVLALPAAAATPEQRGRAAMALTDDSCAALPTSPLTQQDIDEDRARLLDGIDVATLPGPLKNALHARRAALWATVAFERSRHTSTGTAQAAAERALQELAAVDKNQLVDDDQADYNDAAMRVNASRWAAEPLPSRNAGLSVALTSGRPGETCIALTDAQHDAAQPLAQRCTYGTVWPQSVSVNASRSALALAVQPLAGWRELWVFHRSRAAWTVDVLPPAAGAPQLGVIEFAGWVPGGTQLLAARETRVDGRWQRSFEVIRLDTLATERRADRPDALTAFYRWQDAGWKRQTPILR